MWGNKTHVSNSITLSILCHKQAVIETWFEHVQQQSNVNKNTSKVETS